MPARSEVLAFLSAIKERPEDDAPRLMLVDWLTEHGHPRGEFVRCHFRGSRGMKSPARHDGVNGREHGRSPRRKPRVEATGWKSDSAPGLRRGLRPCSKPLSPQSVEVRQPPVAASCIMKIERQSLFVIRPVSDTLRPSSPTA